jgi:hypothetical protein
MSARRVFRDSKVAVTQPDALEVAGVIVEPRHIVTASFGANGSLADTTIFVADRAYEVIAIKEVHEVAGTDAGTVSLQPTKCTGTQSAASGAALTAAVINLKGTANTVVTPTLTSTTANLRLAAGDRIGLDFQGVLTSVAGVHVTVYLKAV